MSKRGLQRLCIEAIKRRGGKAIAITCPPCESGTPDILGAFLGRALSLECKEGRDKPSDLQKYRLQEWGAAGAAAQVVRSVDQLNVILDGIEIRAGGFV